MTTTMQVPNDSPDAEVRSPRAFGPDEPDDPFTRPSYLDIGRAVAHRIVGEANRVAGSVLGEAGYPFGHVGLFPTLDLIETQNAIEARVDVPGLTPDQVDVEVRNDVLRITGEVSTETRFEEGKTLISERRRERFDRTVRLPCPVEEDDVEAEIRQGLLTVRMPKSEAATRRRVPIKG